MTRSVCPYLNCICGSDVQSCYECPTFLANNPSYRKPTKDQLYEYLEKYWRSKF